jgi:phage minor structural protein
LPRKKVRLVESIGEDLGWSFIYGIDLKNIKRKVVSDSIATKVIVLANNNEFGKNGFCTIARSELNYPKETFILNFDYYIN